MSKTIEEMVELLKERLVRCKEINDTLSDISSELLTLRQRWASQLARLPPGCQLPPPPSEPAVVAGDMLAQASEITERLAVLRAELCWTAKADALAMPERPSAPLSQLLETMEELNDMIVERINQLMTEVRKPL